MPLQAHHRHFLAHAVQGHASRHRPRQRVQHAHPRIALLLQTGNGLLTQHQRRRLALHALASAKDGIDLLHGTAPALLAAQLRVELEVQPGPCRQSQQQSQQHPARQLP